jgi:hypothetical protein
MSQYTSETTQRLAQLLQEAEVAYRQYQAHPQGPVQDRGEWCAEYLLASGKLANLFLLPSVKSIREETTEAG